jgi:NADH-quinone oxidoreductase subunit H
MSAWAANLIALLLWPGLLGGVLLGWFYLWLARKLRARLQGRQGPPFYQPFFDFFKLLGKEMSVPVGASRLYAGLPWAACGSALFALALIPAPGSPLKSFPGDLIVFLYLLEMPALCTVLAGFSTRSPYAQVGAAREAMLTLAYNLPFLTAVIALAAHVGSFSLAALASAPFSWAHGVAALAFVLAVPAQVKSNPFSIPNAEQEVAAGALTEYSGPLLALFELSHTLELVALTGLFAVLFLAPLAGSLWALALFLLLSLTLVVMTTVLGAATARLKLNQAFKLYWSWGAGVAVLALIAAVIK